MISASISTGDQTIKTESLPINVNILSAIPGDVILVRFIDRTYKVVMLNEGRLIMVKA